MWLTVHSQVVHILRTPSLQLPGPPAVTRPCRRPSVLLSQASLLFSPFYLLSLLYFSLLFSSLESLISICSLYFLSLHPAAATKALFLSVHWRLVWNRTHARCSALRDRLTAHWGKQDRAGVRKKMREGGILNGQERIKERRKVGGSLVGQIRLTEQGGQR